MTEIHLVTARFERVATLKMPPFKQWPGVVIWGDRVFVAHLSSKTVGPLYVETFAWTAPLDELPDTRPE